MKKIFYVVAGLLILAGSSPAFAQRIAQVERLDVEKDEVRLALSGPASYKTTRTTQPHSLVLEIDNAVLPYLQSTQSTESRWLKEVRAAQFKTEPPTARIVLELSDSASYKIEAQEKSIVIRLGDSGSSKAAEPAPEVQSAGMDSTTSSNGLWLALIALACLSAYIPLRRLNGGPVPAFAEVRMIINEAAEKMSEMGAQMDTISSRVAVMEKKVSMAGAGEACKGSHNTDPRMQEEINNLKSLVKVVIKTLQTPIQI